MVLDCTLVLLLVTNLEASVCAFVSALASICIGAMKEVWDKVSGKGTPEFLDFFWTVVGGIIGFLYVCGWK